MYVASVVVVGVAVVIVFVSVAAGAAGCEYEVKFKINIFILWRKFVLLVKTKYDVPYSASIVELVM